MENKALDNSTLSLEQNKLFNIATEAHTKRDLNTSERLYRKLLSENVKYPQVYNQLAQICANTNRIEEAKSLCKYALQLRPKFVDALVLLADILKNERNFIECINFYRQALNEAPLFAGAHLSLSFSLIQTGKIDEGECSCRKAIDVAPDFLQAKDYLGQILVLKGDLEQAKNIFNELIVNNPKNISAIYSLGNIFKSQGDIEKASSLYQQVININPLYSQAHFTYSHIHHYIDENDPHIALMEREYGRHNIPKENKTQLCFALAKAFEDVGDFKESFKYLDVGNSIRFEQFNYTISPDEVFINNIIEMFNKEDISKLQINSQESKRPIFIVGMPRSGTSLVEKIISTHSQVYAAGELDYIFRLGTSLFIDESSSFLFKKLDSYSESLFEKVGELYLTKITELNHTKRNVTDKFPFNMLLVGLIKIAFPNAKIIHCVRDSKDTCFSIFKQNFTTDNYRFGYNLKTLGQYYKLYQKLMGHWHQTFPNSIYDVQYELLVNNPEQEIKKLIKHCDLAWEKECVFFHKSESVVKTASAFQVRQPMYTSSVGAWEKYHDLLSPLLGELEETS